MVHRPWPQGAASIKVHGVGLLPGNVPQGHCRLGEGNRTITSANIFFAQDYLIQSAQWPTMVPLPHTTEEMRGSEPLRHLPKATQQGSGLAVTECCSPTPLYFRSLPSQKQVQRPLFLRDFQISVLPHRVSAAAWGRLCPSQWRGVDMPPAPTWEGKSGQTRGWAVGVVSCHSPGQHAEEHDCVPNTPSECILHF